MLEENEELEFIEKEIENAQRWHNTYAIKQLQSIKKRLLQAFDERDELERFTRLVITKGVDTSIVSGSKCCSAYNNTMIGLYSTDTWCLTEDEFNFAKEMIEKYGKKQRA